MIRNRLAWMNTIVAEPYYFFHFLLFFSYLPIRTSASSILSPRIHDRLLYREIQAVLAFLVFSAVKMVREETWEALIADTLLYGKPASEENQEMVEVQILLLRVFLLVFALFVDYHLALWYMVGFLVIYILTQQPPFLAPGASISLTPLQLETSLTEGDTSRFWLVEFRALSLSSCARTSRIIPELSITYSNKNLSFGVVDLGLFPNAADKFGIPLHGGTALPTYILFDRNVEVARIPGADFETRFSSPPITKKFLAQHFELDLRLIEYVNEK